MALDGPFTSERLKAGPIPGMAPPGMQTVLSRAAL